MNNTWERAHGLNPYYDDDQDDLDGDGLKNIEEFWNDTYPEIWDSEGDGMPDGWEVDNGLDPLSDDASLDPDGDGFGTDGYIVNKTKLSC